MFPTVQAGFLKQKYSSASAFRKGTKKISWFCPFNGVLDVVVDVRGLAGEEGEDSLSDGLAPPEEED